MSKFVERFTLLLQSRKLNTQSLKKEIGISTTQSGRYLSGYYEPSLKNALKICDYFGCSLDYLMGLDTEINRNKQTQAPSVDKFLNRYNSLLKENNTNHHRVAKELKFNRNNLIYWQQHKTFPTLTILANLAQHLHTSIEYLIGRSDNTN